MLAMEIGRISTDIEHSLDYSELRIIRDDVQRQLENSSPSAPGWPFTVFVNQFHDALIKRTVTLAEHVVAQEGMGPPPVSYGYIIFGSGGREEQTLWSDQDSGLIYTDSESDEDISTKDVYFTRLSNEIVSGLQKVGYPPCDGNVLCNNPRWRKTTAGWKKLITDWIDSAEWENIRQLLIIADGRTLYGDESLFKQVKQHLIHSVEQYPSILTNMLQNTLRHKVLIGIFGQLLLEQYGEDAGGIDIKYGAYIPMVNAIRLVAIQQGYDSSSTLARLTRLADNQIIAAREYEVYKDAFAFVLKLRSMTTHHLEDDHYTSSGKLPHKLLTKEWKYELKKSLNIGKQLQKWVQKLTMKQHH